MPRRILASPGPARRSTATALALVNRLRAEKNIGLGDVDAEGHRLAEGWLRPRAGDAQVPAARADPSSGRRPGPSRGPGSGGGGLGAAGRARAVAAGAVAPLPAYPRWVGPRSTR